MDSDAPDTPRVCDACGGVDHRDCRWCSGGLQDAAQIVRWRAFRVRMRAMSGTYALFQALIEEVTDRLEQHNTEVARDLAAEGRLHLSRWMEAEADSNDREVEAQGLLRFHRRAMALLSR